MVVVARARIPVYFGGFELGLWRTRPQAARDLEAVSGCSACKDAIVAEVGPTVSVARANPLDGRTDCPD